MERQESKPEELEPLQLTKLRDLDVTRDADDSGRPAFIGSASAVVRRADHVYVVGDEELDLAVFRISADEPGEMRQALPGDLPDGDAERAKAKPDLEALSVLPPFDGAPYGGLLGLGSGSGAGRDRGFYWELDAAGALAGEPAVIDLKPLYDLLREELGDLNIEGAAVRGERLLVFHRGNSDGGHNAVAELELARVVESLTGDHAIDVEELVEVREYDLGDLGGTRLCFSDATPVADDLVVFTASAEADDDAGEEIRGSVVGTIDTEGRVRRLRTIDRRWKVEGVHAAVEAGVIDFVFVCDQDDPGQASPLLSATMPVEGGFERS